MQEDEEMVPHKSKSFAEIKMNTSPDKREIGEGPDKMLYSPINTVMGGKKERPKTSTKPKKGDSEAPSFYGRNEDGGNTNDFQVEEDDEAQNL